MGFKLPSFLALSVATLSLSAVVSAAEDSRQIFEFADGGRLSTITEVYRFRSRHQELSGYQGAGIASFGMESQFRNWGFHFSSTFSEGERHQRAGFVAGPVTMALFHGGADGFSKARNPFYEDLNPYFFHGGKSNPFQLEGGALNLALGKVNTQFAVSRVTANGLQDRYGYYAGFSTPKLQAGVFELQRGRENVGYGYRVQTYGKRFGLSYREIASTYDASVRQLSLNWRGKRVNRFSLSLEQEDNDLFAAGNDQRVMFRIRRPLGSVGVLNAAEEEGGDKSVGVGALAGIGVGIGLVAVAVSSGSDDGDQAQRFTTRNEAAFSVMNFINPVSVQQNREHGGWIYRNADGTFGFTDPVQGEVASVNIGAPASVIPSGTRQSASYHTHGGPDPRFDNENFSPTDLAADRIQGVDGYLGTPAGFLKLHDHETGNITVLGRINN